MRLIRFFLLLSLIPNLLYAFKQHAGEKIYNHSLNQWNAANGHISEANKCDPSQRKQSIYFLQKAIACYRHAIADIDLLLKKIKEHKQEKADWHKPLKKRSKEHRLSCIAQVESLEGPLRSLMAWEQEEELFNKVKPLYEEGIEKKEKARVKELETPRRLNNTKEVVSHLKEALQLYEEALVSIRAAAQLLASSSREEDKAALKQITQNIEEAANRCKQAALEWPHVVDSQREELKKRIAVLREESQILQKKELKRACFEVQKQMVPLLEQLIESDIENTKEASEELSELHNQISLFKKEADAKHLTETFPPLSREEFERREKERRSLFFANKALLLRPDLFLAKMLHNRSYPFVLPIDGQMSKQGDKTTKDLTLFTGQFYRFLMQNDSPTSHLFIKVHKNGELIHEEQINLPTKNTSAWEHYLRADQTLIIPETKLKTEFGLDLRLNFVLDPSCPFTLIIAQRGSYTDYQFSFSLKENNTETFLYSSHFIPPAPWQLAMLRKPTLLHAGRPLPQPSPNTSSFIKEKQDPLPKYQEAASFPALDQFVEKLYKDPLAIAQYVHNEIELVDPFLHQEGEVFQAPRIFRNPYTTFLEKRGSAWEQCMLLVYLLRQAGYQAVYAYDKPSLLPKAFVEKLLLTKLPNKEEILLNYPWVLFFNGEEWISLFPWMKEIHINEGYDLYHFMPEEYANADRWLARYLRGDENILKHIGPEGNDTVGLLFMRFVEEELRKQGLSLADVGIHRRQLKKQCVSWDDFPRPSIQGKPQILKQLDKEKKLFADVEIEVFSHQNPHKKIQINRYFVDLNLTALFLQCSPDGASNHRLYLREMDLQGKGEERFLSLDPTDLTIGVKVTHCPFLEKEKDKSRLLSKHTYPFFIEKGTYAALCLSFGTASTKTTSYFYEKLAHEKEEDRHLHALLSLVGAAYFEKCNQIQQLLANLHKIASPFFLGFALAKLSPNLTEDPLKKFPQLKFPQIDMLFNAHKQDLSSSYNACTYDISLKQFQTLAIADASSNEHQILREVFQDPCPISTVKLLQLAHLKHQKEEGLGTGFLAFNRFNFACAENTPDRAGPLYFSHLKDLNLRSIKEAAKEQWNDVKEGFHPENSYSDYAYAYMTPGAISSQDGSYKEIGTLIIHPQRYQARISHRHLVSNGGLGSSLPARLPPGYRPSSTVQDWRSSFNPNAPTLNLYPLPSSLTTPPPSTFQWRSDLGSSSNYVPKSYLFLDSIKQRTDFNLGQSSYGYKLGQSSPLFSSTNPFLRSTKEQAALKWEQIPIAKFIQERPIPDNKRYEGSYTPKRNSPPLPFTIPPKETTKWKADVRADHKSDTHTVADPVDMVTGAFYIDELDLVLPGSFPLEIRRNYNSQNPLQSPFGWGWKLSLNPTLIKQEGKLYAAEADGTVIVYKLNAEKGRWEVLPEENPDLFNFNKKGIDSSANPFHAYIEDNILYGADGSKRIFEDYLLKKWINAAGSFLTFSYKDGRLTHIESSSGSFCSLHYNQEGRLSEIYTKDGRVICYHYNFQGDLIEVVLPNQATISYEYDHCHRIIRETKPHGNVLENIYDEQGRVVKQRSPLGPQQEMITSASFIYQEGTTIAIDAIGATTTYKIFQKQIYKIIDPLGYQILQSWFIDSHSWFDPETESIIPWEQEGSAPRSLKASTDKRGLTTYYLYDKKGNLQELGLKGEDLTGDGKTLLTKKYSYNAQNLCIEEETLGQKILTTYDSLFPYLPARIEKYSGSTLLSFVAFEYSALGQLQKEDHSGSVTLWKYDTRGFPIQKIQITDTEDPDVITEFLYNHQGQCVQKSTADAVQKVSYDIMGNPTESLLYSPSGTLLFAKYVCYNLNNQPIEEQRAHPHHTLHLDYHACGLLKASRQSLYPSDSMAYTLYEYDTRGQLIQEVDPLGYCTYRDYDLLGRVKSETKEELSTFFTYEEGGLVKTILSPSGAQTTRLYTTNGLLKEETYPDETKSSFLYDGFGRLIRETKNGITWEIDYDDPARRITRFHQLSKTTHIQEFDLRGNLIRHIDPAGYFWEKTYDALGRLKSETNPNGEQTRWNYQGNITIRLSPNGEKTVSRYEGGRIVASEAFSFQGQSISSYSSHHNPETNIQKTVQGEEITITETNVLGLPIRVQKGNIITTYEYDACGNCISSTDGKGNTTLQTFDHLRRIIKKELPDGSLLHYTYDLDSHLIEWELPGNLTWKASYDLMGRKSSEELHTDSQISNRWDYTYENGYLKEKKSPSGSIYTYLYDSQGRVIQEHVDGWKRSYTYDPRGLLFSVEQMKEEAPSPWISSFLWTPNEEHSLIKRSYDPSGRLSSEEIFLNSILLQQTDQTWSPSGRSLQIEDHKRDFTYQNNELITISTPNIELSYTYNSSGALIQKTTPFTTTRFDYYPSALPKQIHTQLPYGSYQEFLAWDPTGKLSWHSTPTEEKRFTYSSRGHLQSAGEERYEFDFGALGRGIRTAAPHSHVPPNGLDPFGKIITETDSQGTTKTTYDPLGQVISQTTSHNQKQFKWDPWGRLLKVTDATSTWEASYDALGRRLQTRYTPSQGVPLITTSLYDPEEEFQEIGLKYRDKIFWKIYANGSCDAVTDETGASVVLLHNTLEHLIAVVSETETLYSENLPSSYGPQTNASPPSDLLTFARSLTWRSQSQDPTGLIWMGARYYDPKGGRFLSPDPVGFPFHLDPYAYANGDPINYTDPDGRFSSKVYESKQPSVISSLHPFLTDGGYSLGIKGINFLSATFANKGWTRSGPYTVGSIDLPNKRMGFINGIDYTRDEAITAASDIIRYNNGAKIYGIYNATHKPVLDVVKCIAAHSGVHSTAVQFLKNEWLGFFADKGAEARYLQICTSGGAFPVKQALLLMPESIRQRIIVLAIAPATIIPDKLCLKAYNYACKYDFVPWIDIVNRIKYSDQLQLLEPHPNGSRLGHRFLDPIFDDPKNRHVTEFIKE